MHVDMNCIGSDGFEIVVNRIAVSLFEVVFQPMTNILLHRYVYSFTKCSEEHLLTNRITRKLTLGE